MFFAHTQSVFVVNQSSFDWLSFLLGGAAGSFFAAVIVLGIDRFITRRAFTKEQTARRTTFLSRLKLELERIDDNIQPYKVGKAIIQDKIVISSLEPLLEGSIIHYSEESKLVASLMDCQVALIKYNNLVEAFTLSQVASAMNDTAHKQAYDNVRNRHMALIVAKKVLLGQF